MRQLTYALYRSAFLLGIALVFHWSFSGCSKTPNPMKNDSLDTVHVHHDSAKFYVTFDIVLSNTSGVFQDTLIDNASMIIYVVDGVVKVPTDSLENFAPIVIPETGSDANYIATYIPDKIGLINIVGASGVVTDTTVAMFLSQVGTVTPKWQLTAKSTGITTAAGGDPTPGWPAAFGFSLKQKSQFAFQLQVPGTAWTVWVYKEY